MPTIETYRGVGVYTKENWVDEERAERPPPLFVLRALEREAGKGKA